jgi:hypothetical protein
MLKPKAGGPPPCRLSATAYSIYSDNEDLHNLYSYSNITRHLKSNRMSWAGHVARTREDRECIRCRWKHRRKETTRKTETKMEEWDRNGSYGDWMGDVLWIQLAQGGDRWRTLVKTVINIRFLAPWSS